MKCNCGWLCEATREYRAREGSFSTRRELSRALCEGEWRHVQWNWESRAVPLTTLPTWQPRKPRASRADGHRQCSHTVNSETHSLIAFAFPKEKKSVFSPVCVKKRKIANFVWGSNFWRKIDWLVLAYLGSSIFTCDSISIQLACVFVKKYSVYKPFSSKSTSSLCIRRE